MLAKGPQSGRTPKADALKVLPRDVSCKRESAMGITGYVVRLADGVGIGSGGNAHMAWDDARAWGLRQIAVASKSRTDTDQPT